MTRTRFRVTGTVQGVGFRPFVHRHAVALGLSGFVRNDSDGVLIEVEGEPAGIDALVQAITSRPPPLARVATVEALTVPPAGEPGGFRIEQSQDLGLPAVPVSVDTATCDDCLADMGDRANRRYRYPFTNCTNCGPRYTIVQSVPYDRPSTTMRAFAMCEACQREYDDPFDRRFHAQPNACPVCGPQLAWLAPDGRRQAAGEDALAAAGAALLLGSIIAVKGVGGYHLAADATNGGAVAELRRRKSRDAKPFAVMVADLEEARHLCAVDDAAAAALVSASRPIVILPARVGTGLAAAIAPGLDELGLFLPYSPLHHLLLGDIGRPLVMTSGNLSDEPIAHDDQDAVARLGPLVDALLTHDRGIHIRCDDSVVRSRGRTVQMLRRARGEAPEPIRLPVPARRPILAVGAELKSTISVAKGPMVVPSHHIGDLEHLATYRSFLQAVDHLSRLSGVVPELVAHDLHPEYLSTKFASDLDLPACGVQHHHAHVASCLVEHGHPGPVLGIAFDGLGYGTDGALWGGEFLVADLVRAERAAHLRPAVMPGGGAAIREPWRMAAAWASAAVGREAAVELVRSMDGRAAAVVDMVERGLGPVTTSAGRLFDAVAALLGGRSRVSYEAQAAIELEVMARRVPRSQAPTYEGAVVAHESGPTTVLDPAPLLAALLADRATGVDPAVLAAGFHEGLGRASAALASRLAAQRGLDTVVLTGGVFQNVRLSEILEQELTAAGLVVLVHGRIPPNDGGISIGQAAVAAARDA